MSYEELINEAENEKIEVCDMYLEKDIKGLYSDKIIAINSKVKTTSEKACILAEEIGHYHTTSGNIIDQSKVENRKQEKRARVWAYQKLMPLASLIKAYEWGIQNRYELSVFLDVTEEFIEAALIYYKEKYGSYKRVDDYIICFNQLYIVKSIRGLNQ